MRKYFIAAAGVAASLAVMAAPAAASHSWNGYHWGRTSNPFGIKVGNNVSSGWTTYFNTSNSDWSQSSVLDLNGVAGSSNKRCAAVAGTVQVCNGNYGYNGWLGLAQIWLSGGHIAQGTAKMNDSYFNSSTYNNPNEKLHVMCQEVGHTFGLGHTSEDGSSQNTCMDYFSNTGANATSTTSTHPNQHDYDMLSSIYSHTDASSTLASSASSAKGPSMAEREDSHAYQTDREDSQRYTVLTERFSDGSLRVTHYTWAR